MYIRARDPTPPLRMSTTPTITDRLALHVLQAGALAVVLASVPYKVFELDRFFVPKELVLHVTAVLAVMLCAFHVKRLALARVDQLVALFLVIGLASALFATNWWLAARAVAVSVSGASCFWCARSLVRRGLTRPLLAAVALAGIVGAVTALLQAYGLRSEYVSLNRAPGGTFGNRNFMAHLSVIIVPTLVFVAATAATRRSFAWWTGGLALVGGALVLSRSRAAWLALLVGALVLLPLVIAALRRGRGTLRLRRVIALPLAAFGGGAVALLMPNTLDWRSDSPYLDTARSVVNYKDGSGRGRLVQYGNSLRMSVRHPLLGVGPGNWAVTYPKFAAPNDPSLANDGMTSNPWPSSDWMTFVSERGVASFVLLLLAMLALLADGLRGVRDGRTPEDRLSACILLGTLAILMVVGTFDAVLLLPVPALVAWTLLGALSPPSRERAVVHLALPMRAVLLLGVMAAGGFAVSRSASQLTAMSIFATTSRATELERASLLDPGSYRIHMRLADAHARRGNCRRVIAHARPARELYPYAARPRRLLAACGR